MKYIIHRYKKLDKRVYTEEFLTERNGKTGITCDEKKAKEFYSYEEAFDYKRNQSSTWIIISKPIMMYNQILEAFKNEYADKIESGDISGDEINRWCDYNESKYPDVDMRKISVFIFQSLGLV